MKIQTAAVLGAGAVGSYLIWGLCDKLKENLIVVAEGERKERLQKEGLIINGQRYCLNVRTPQQAHGVDLLFVAAKHRSLPDALDNIADITGEHTIVMSLMNGIESEKTIGNRIGQEHMLYAMIKIAAERDGNRIVFDGENTQGIYFGEADPTRTDDRLRAVNDLFEGTPIHRYLCKDIVRQMWGKFALNVGYNLPQAILGVGVGAYRDSVYAKDLMEKLIDEVTAVASAKGIDIRDLAEELKIRPLLSKAAKYSTLQDLEAKRPTEIDMFAGAMKRMGKEENVPTPYSDFAYNAVKVLEEKNEGKFDY